MSSYLQKPVLTIIIITCYLSNFSSIFLNASDLKPLKIQNVSVDNFTSCDEFLNGTTLNVTALVDVDWRIFYFWNHQDERSYNIRFSLAGPTLVKRFQVELEDDLKPPVNWSQTELFMETGIEFSALFIKGDTSGLYRIIPNFAFQVKNTPLMTFALKIVEPGYLGIVNCKFRLCYALAPVERMPSRAEIEQAAAKLGFWSDFGRSHLETSPGVEVPRELLHEEDDAEDDVQEQIEMDSNNLALF